MEYNTEYVYMCKYVIFFIWNEACQAVQVLFDLTWFCCILFLDELGEEDS